MNEHASPEWHRWFAELPARKQKAIRAHYEQTAAHPDIAPWHRNAEYARAKLLLDHCAEKHGWGG